MSIETKKLGLKLSSLEDDGTFTGLLSAYGNVDGGNDVVEPGAYTKTILESGGRLVMCWQHDQKDPIGAFTMTDTPEGLVVKGQLNLDDAVPSARRAYSMMKFLHGVGLKMGLSIGYEVIKREFKNGLRYLKELRLREGSLVTTPMNDLTWVTDVKGGGQAKDFSSSLEAIQLWSTKYQLIQALEESLMEVFYSETDAAKAIEGVDTILDQFSATYKEWIRKPLLLQMWGMKEAPAFKAGRSISAASRAQIEAAISNLQALLGEASTSPDEAAKSTGAADSAEPEVLHSVAELLNNFKF
jgi:HK97 family phage prohead protease